MLEGKSAVWRSYKELLRKEVQAFLRASRNDSVCIKHPAALPVFRAKSNQIWFAIKKRGGEQLAYKLAHGRAAEWQRDFQKLAASKGNLYLCLCSGKSCPVDSSVKASGVVRVTHWEKDRILRSSSLEHRLLCSKEFVGGEEWRQREKIAWGGRATAQEDPRGPRPEQRCLVLMRTGAVFSPTSLFGIKVIWAFPASRD